MTTPDYTEFAAVAAAANARGIMVSAAGVKEIDRLLADHFAGAGKKLVAQTPDTLERREAMLEARNKWLVDALHYAIQFHVYAEASRDDVAKVVDSLSDSDEYDNNVAALVQMPKWCSSSEAQDAVDRALTSPRVDERAQIERECADLIARYYRREIGELMHQAAHWAEIGKPFATHHRLHKADSYFQIVSLMERDPAKGWKLPFDEIRHRLARQPLNPPGTYPPTAELHRFRDASFVAALATTPANPREKLEADLVEARADVALWKREAADRSEGMVQLNLDRAAMGVAILQLRECVQSLIAIRPSNWTDDPEDAAVWSTAEAVLRETAQL